MSRLSYLMSLTPRETYRILRRRLPGSRNGPAWTPDELLSSPKYSRGIRFAELLMRQEAVVRRHLPNWLPLEFEGKRVVEVGCGPLAGYGPLAIFCGAVSFESAEPEWDASLFFSVPVTEKYLRVFHADLSALYGPRMTFREFIAALRERVHVEVRGFETSSIRGPVDVVLSQSVLEHVFPLEATLSKLAAIQGPATQFLHLIDFGNHYPTENAFEGLYDQPAAAYIARRGKAINCLRVSDIANIFSSAGIEAAVIPSRVIVDGYRGVIHPWWRERYAESALFTQLSIVANTR